MERFAKVKVSYLLALGTMHELNSHFEIGHISGYNHWLLYIEVWLAMRGTDYALLDQLGRIAAGVAVLRPQGSSATLPDIPSFVSYIYARSYAFTIQPISGPVLLLVRPVEYCLCRTVAVGGVCAPHMRPSE